METLLTLAAFLVLMCALAIYNTKPRIWIPATAAALFLIVQFDLLPSLLAILVIVVWAIPTFFMVSPTLRRRLLMKRLMRWMKKSLPAISADEKQVLAAGGLWWEKALFSGQPNWQKLADIPKESLTEAEQSFLDNEVNTLCQMLNDWEIFQNRDLSPEAWDYIKAQGFWGLIIPKEYGGRDFSASAHSIIISKIATRSMSAALNVMVPNSLGPAEFMIRYGTDEQKSYYLPRMAKGEEITCFALTGPTAGSDATSIPDTGVICYDEYRGKKMLGIRLNFNKRYITLAPIATLMGVAFKLSDPEKLFSDKEKLGITIAVVPADLPGVTRGNRHLPSNLSFMNGPITGENVFIPMDLIIGGPDYAGRGWEMMMECLAVGRSISLPSLSTAACKLSVRMTSAYAVVREQFKRSIGEFEGVGLKLGEMVGTTYAVDAIRQFTAQAVQADTRPSVASAIAKYHMTESARRVFNAAMDIHAGRGIQLGPRNYLGLINNVIPTMITVEGANILTRNLIIFGQGVWRCHPYLAEELVALADYEKNGDLDSLKTFDTIFMKHMGFSMTCAAKTFCYGLSGARWQRGVSGPFHAHYKQLNRMTNAFALLTDVTLVVLGKKLKFKEALSARLGDVLSYLYLMSAVLYVSDGRDSDVVAWCFGFYLNKTAEAIHEICDNYPSRWLGWVLRKMIFPWGRGYATVSDRLTLLLSNRVQTDANLREKVTKYCYVGKEINDPTGRMEQAWEAMRRVKLSLEKLETAAADGTLSAGLSFSDQVAAAVKQGVISQQESEELIQMDTLRTDAIQVDEFKPGLWSGSAQKSHSKPHQSVEE